MTEPIILAPPANTQTLDILVQSLAEREKALVVKDQQSYTAAGNFLIEARSYLNDVNAKLDVGINSAKAHLDTLKNQKAGYVDPVKRLIDAVKAKAELWRAEEKKRADEEERRRQEEINRAAKQKAEEDKRQAEAEATEKRRQAVAQINADLKSGAIGKREAAKRLKEAGAEEEAAKQTAAAVAEEAKNAPPPTVRVAPAVPTVAGIRNQTYYYAELISSPDPLILALANAWKDGDMDRFTFLRRFVRVSETEISAFARETKDSEAVVKALPGVRAWSKG
jgi:pyruvate/2-oxoglutarate dehydrogenase complex dihydrolipoamide acyltransferase (E2) component